MKFLRNKEIRKLILWTSLLGILASAIAFFWDKLFGVYVFILALCYSLFFLVFTAHRYQELAELAAQIDRILHDESLGLAFAAYTEGELAILANEIAKLVGCLRKGQNDLKKDKAYLADALADISHQIRTPLTSIGLLLQLLQDVKLTEGRKKELIRELETLLARIEWLITALLKLSKLDAETVTFKVETVTLESLIQKALEPLRIAAELREQTIKISAAGNFCGDSAWTAEAIGNVLKNCLEHNPTPGTITIKARENPLYAEITIADEGEGIAAEDLPRIFERFYKGRQPSTGFGIGLALARAIVVRENGSLKAENQEKGALFSLRFYKGSV